MQLPYNFVDLLEECPRNWEVRRIAQLAPNLTNKPCGLSLLLFLFCFLVVHRHDRAAEYQSIELDVTCPVEVPLVYGSGGSHYQRCDRPAPMCHLRVCNHTSERDSAKFHHQPSVVQQSCP
jgi:hypothetical protein